MNDEFEIPESLFQPPIPVEDTQSSTLPVGISTDSSPWPPRLAFDIAMGVDSTEVLLDRYEIDTDQLVALIQNPMFQRQVDAYKQDIRDNGLSFKAKAKLQAETYLGTLHDLIKDRSVGAPTRLDAIKSVVKWAGLEPGTTKDSAQNQSTTRLVFAWQDGSGQVAVEVKSGGDTD